MNSSQDQIQPSGDFFDLLQRSGYRLHSPLENANTGEKLALPQATTVLAFHYKDGVLMAGDRRATAGNSIMYERCEKVSPIDD